MLKARIPVTSKPDWEATSARPVSRRRRRRYSIPDDDSGRWMVSYADFMTLLFAFFVVMYATVSGDGDTLKKLHDLAARVEQSISGTHTPSAEDVRTPAEVQGMAAVLRQVASAYGDGALELEVEPGEIAITISSHVLFASGDAQIAHAAMPLLSDLTGVLRQSGQRIVVEGHTDDRPIQTARFPSNWELSAARAATVAHLLTVYGVQPSAVTASGLGEHHPVRDNKTAAGRAANRRVVVRVQFARDDA